jgi:hypothetical protein
LGLDSEYPNLGYRLANKRVQSDAAAAARIGARNWLCDAGRIDAHFGKDAARLTRRALGRPIAQVDFGAIIEALFDSDHLHLKQRGEMLGWFTKHKLEDSVFGRIIFHKPGYWEGNTYFAPVEKTVQTLITAEKEGPSERQRSFYRQLEQEYPELEQELGDMLYDTYSNWKEGFPRSRIWEVFALDSIAISNFSEEYVHLQLSYGCANDEHLFTIELDGLHPRGLFLDG